MLLRQVDPVWLQRLVANGYFPATLGRWPRRRYRDLVRHGLPSACTATAEEIDDGQKNDSAQQGDQQGANAIADNRYRGPDVLRRVALDQVRAGLDTPGHKGAVLDFWDTVAQLIIPCLNPDNVARLAAQIVARRCKSMALSTVEEIETRAEYRRIALKSAATRKARAAQSEKAVRP